MTQHLGFARNRHAEKTAQTVPPKHDVASAPCGRDLAVDVHNRLAHEMKVKRSRLFTSAKSSQIFKNSSSKLRNFDVAVISKIIFA